MGMGQIGISSLDSELSINDINNNIDIVLVTLASELHGLSINDINNNIDVGLVGSRSFTESHLKLGKRMNIIRRHTIEDFL